MKLPPRKWNAEEPRQSSFSAPIRCSRVFRLFLLVVFLMVFKGGAGIAASRFAAAGQEQPNFLLLLSDDQTYRALGLLGELEVKTPNLDRLAERGLRFTHCFNQGGYSGAVCIPSRAMLNTGRTVWQCGSSNRQGVAEGVPLWGETLRRAGYATFMAGKWHLDDKALARSFETLGPLTGGFLPSTPEDGPAYFRPSPKNPWRSDDPHGKGHWLQVDGRILHSSERIANAAIDYLRAEGATSVKPFFMYIAFNAPHDPRQAPRPFLDLYPRASLKVPPNFLPAHPFPIDGPGYNGRDEILAPYPRTSAVVQAHLQEYYAMITHLDAQIGRILEALAASGKAGNTIVIFTSDQGLALGQHGLFGKQNLYEHSIRMPFIMAGPGIPKGRRNDALFYMQSLFATTCEMAAIPVPDTVQFPSLVPLVTGQKRRLQDALYEAYLDRQRAIRTEDWKLIRTPQERQVQLFHIKDDPWETRNLAGIPKYASTMARLDERLRGFMIELKDPMPPALLSAGTGADLVQVPGTVIDYSPAAAEIYIGSPSLAVLPDGAYLASHDEFGPKSAEFTRAITHVFKSSDRGQSWRRISTIQGAFWSTLFVHRGAVYLLGTDKHLGNVVIRRSLDAGFTWTSPTNRTTGLLSDQGEYHCAPVPVVQHQGRLWRAMERRNPPPALGIDLRAGVLSVPVEADLLDATQWTFSEFLSSDRAWNGGDMGAWLEGNAVVTPDGLVVDMLRVQTQSPREKAALIQITPDGRQVSFNPSTGFVDFPGGAKKFTIRFDSQSKLYWSLASIVQAPPDERDPGRFRNTLALTSSPDLAHWSVRRILLHHPEALRHGFQYVDWLFDGDDIIAACRTAYDDSHGGAHNYHDANLLTFHRVRNFR